MKEPNKPGSEVIKNARWIENIPIKDRTQVGLLMVSLEMGEAEVLALARELQADLILVDEEKARKSALIAGFNVMGLLALFILAENLDHLQEVKPLIEELRI